jgi:hypothetical protein
MSTLVNGTTPVTRRVRAYFAPVNRTTGAATIFDAAQNGAFTLENPPAPWVDLGWCKGFRRRNSEGAATGITALRTGSPAIATGQVRTEFEAAVQLEFANWGKLQMALACGAHQMNLLRAVSGAASNGSGGAAADAVALQPGSTANALQMGAAASGFSAGDLIVVDSDYTGQTGYVGAGVSGAYVRTAADVNSDPHYIRRTSLNVGRIAQIADGALQLESPLLAGAPAGNMKVSHVAGFVDREGGSFFQEWSALFVLEGEQGDRVIFHYPRLQAMQGAAESVEALTAPLERIRLAGAFRALPVIDANDDEKVLCFRSYLPG